MLTLTPLLDVAAFDAAARDKLAPYWITTAEEFVTTAAASNQQFGTALAALAQVLGTSEAEVRALVESTNAVLPASRSFGVSPRAEVELGTGAILENMHFPEVYSYDLPLELPAEVNLTELLAPPRQQGKRNTCVAFTLVALYQHTSGDLSDLSEQFLYWACKERDGIPHIQGTKPDVALEVLSEMGVCTEQTWPYQAQVLPGNEGQGPPPPTAMIEAQQRRILSYRTLPPRDIHQIKGALAAGHALLLGLPIYEHWTGTWQARTLGRVRVPLPGEGSLGGHAVAALGYRDDASVPGGGYFIVRNSWGTSWATQNPDGPGYCHIPYRLVFENNLACCLIESVAAPSAPVAPPPVPVVEPTPTTTRLAPPLAGAEPTAQLPGPALPTEPSLHEEVQSLYAEARAIRDQLNTLVEQLAALTQRTRR